MLHRRDARGSWATFPTCQVVGTLQTCSTARPQAEPTLCAVFAQMPSIFYGRDRVENMRQLVIEPRGDPTVLLDESAHDWRFVRLGRELGWSGVALKTCKTQSGALLSCCWAKAHGMTLMVQDLSNPMLAQIPHVILAARVGTIMGIETNGMQFYPEASRPEAAAHPGIYQRRNGRIDLSTLRGAGFGYQLEKMKRELPTAVAQLQA